MGKRDDGITGTITDANSLIGCGDQNGELTVTPLTNGNYVVSNDQWNGARGEVTWGSGATGVDGTVSAANSLIGSHGGDAVGEHVVLLTKGNYVVDSPQWNGGFGASGAVTWCSDTTGLSGTISDTNSLIGNSGDEVGGWADTSPFTASSHLPTATMSWTAPDGMAALER